jgi:peroxiredoxin
MDEVVKSDLKKFILNFKKFSKDKDKAILVNKVRDTYVNPALKSKDNTDLINFISKLGTAFRKKNHKIYLISILKGLIDVKNVKTSTRKKQNKVRSV